MLTNISVYISNLNFTLWFISIFTLFMLYPILESSLVVIKTTTIDYYNKILLFKTITNDKRNCCFIIMSFFNTILCTFIDLLKQRYMNNVTKVPNKKNFYEIKFIIGGRIYKLLVNFNYLFPKRFGVRHIMRHLVLIRFYYLKACFELSNK